MASPKTSPSGASVKAVVDAIDADARRADVRAVMKIMRSVTGNAPKMCGESPVASVIPRGTAPLTP